MRTLLAALTHPPSVIDLSPVEWDLLVRQARRGNLLARLANVFCTAGILAAVPEAPRRHLRAALMIAERQAVSVRWEVACIRRALAPTGVRVVLLKGAAYTMAGLRIADGRLYSDVDVLVPKHRIADVEAALMLNGWQGVHRDPYDQRYYRTWAHEIPPMRHGDRGTTIDVHHNLLPPRAGKAVDVRSLLDTAIRVAGADDVYTLQPIDMLLHSATHLFHEGEFANGLRDLVDLDGLMRENDSSAFWAALVPRARALGLARSLYYALTLAERLLRTPVPPAVLAASRSGAPSSPVAAWMTACYARALRPLHASVETPAVKAARFALYLRAHWLRLPPHRLPYHLARKAFQRRPRPDAA